MSQEQAKPEALEWSRQRGSRASACLECGEEPAPNRRYCNACRARKEKQKRLDRIEDAKAKPCARDGCDRPRHVMKSQVSAYCLEHKNQKAAEHRERVRPRPRTEERSCELPDCDQTFVWSSMHAKRRTCSKEHYEALRSHEWNAKQKARRLAEKMDGKRWCSGCNAIRPVGDFSEKGRSCRECVRAAARRRDEKRRAEDPEKVREYQRQASRKSRFRTKYGITPEEFDAIVARQKGQCAICRKVKTLVPDHCHGGSGFRGAICGNCNTTLGFALDNPEILENAAAYLRAFYGPATMGE